MGLGVKDSAHNTYLRFLAEMGILGLMLFVLLLWKCWKLGVETGRAAANPFDRKASAPASIYSKKASR